MQLLQRMRAGKDDPAAVEECCFELADDPLQLADVPPAQVAYEVLNSLRDFSDRPRLAAAACTVLKHLASERTSQAVLVRMGAIDRVTNSMSCHADAADVQAAGLAFLAIVAASAPAEPGEAGTREDIRHLLAHHGVAALARGVLRTHSASGSVVASAASLLDVVAARPDLRRHVATHDTVAACAFALHRHARDLRAALPLVRTLCAVCLSHGAEEDAAGAVEEGPGLDPVELPRQALAALVRAIVRAVGAHVGGDDGAYPAIRDSSAADTHQRGPAPLEPAAAELIAAGIQLLAGLGSVTDEDTATAALVEMARSGGCTTVARASAATAAADAEIAMDATSLLSAVLHDASVFRVLAEGEDADALQGLASAVAATVYAAKRGVSERGEGEGGVVPELEEAAREVASTLAARQREAREAAHTPAPAPAPAPKPESVRNSVSTTEAGPSSAGEEEEGGGQGGAAPPSPPVPGPSPQPDAGTQPHHRVRVVRRRRKKATDAAGGKPQPTVRDVSDASALAEGQSTDDSEPSPAGAAGEEGEEDAAAVVDRGGGPSVESPAAASAHDGGWAAMLSPELEAASQRVAEVVAARAMRQGEAGAAPDAGLTRGAEGGEGEGGGVGSPRGQVELDRSASESEGSEGVWEGNEEQEEHGGPAHSPSRGTATSPDRTRGHDGTVDDGGGGPTLAELLAMPHDRLARRAAGAQAAALRWRNAWRDATNEASSTSERLRGDAARQQAAAHKQGLRVRQLHSAYSRVRRELRDATAAHEETADKLRRVSSRTAAAEKEIARLSRELVLARERATQVEHVHSSVGLVTADLRGAVDRLQRERDSLRDALDALKIEHSSRLQDEAAAREAERERTAQAREAAALAAEDAESALREAGAAHRRAATLATRVHVLEEALEEVHPMARPREVAARYPRRLKGMPYSPSHAARGAAARQRAQEQAWMAEQARSGGPAVRTLTASTDSVFGGPDAGTGNGSGSGPWADESVADALSRLRRSSGMGMSPLRSPPTPPARGRSRGTAPSGREQGGWPAMDGGGSGDGTGDRVPGGEDTMDSGGADGAETGLQEPSMEGHGARLRRPRSLSETPQRQRRHSDPPCTRTPSRGRPGFESQHTNGGAGAGADAAGPTKVGMAGRGGASARLDITAASATASWSRVDPARTPGARLGQHRASGEQGRRAGQGEEEEEEEVIHPVDAACGAFARDLARSFVPRRKASQTVRRRTQDQALGSAVEAVLQARSAFVATVLAQPSTRAAAQRAAQIPPPSPETAEEEAIVASGILPLSFVRNALWAHGVFSPPLEPRIFSAWVDDVWGRGCSPRSAGLADWIHLLLRAAQARHPRLPTMYQSLRFLVESHFPKLAHRALRWRAVSQRVQRAATTTAAAAEGVWPPEGTNAAPAPASVADKPVRGRRGKRAQRPHSAGPARPRPTANTRAAHAGHLVPDLRRSSPAAWQRLTDRGAGTPPGPALSGSHVAGDASTPAAEVPRGSSPHQSPQQPTAAPGGGASDMADVEQMLDRERRALQDLFLSYCAAGEGEAAEAAADELRRGKSEGLPTHALPTPLFVQMARDFRIVPTLISKARLLKLCSEVVPPEEQARRVQWGRARPRAESGQLTFPQFLFALGKIALTEIPVAEGAETPTEQMVALLRWMDESRGKEKLACMLGLPQVRHFYCSGAGEGV